MHLHLLTENDSSEFLLSESLTYAIVSSILLFICSFCCNISAFEQKYCGLHQRFIWVFLSVPYACYVILTSWLLSSYLHVDDLFLCLVQGRGLRLARHLGCGLCLTWPQGRGLRLTRPLGSCYVSPDPKNSGYVSRLSRSGQVLAMCLA